MIRKLSLLLAGALCAITVGVFAQQSTIGGQQARPRFQSVGVGAAAPVSAGRVTLAATGTPMVTFNQTGGAADNRIWQQYIDTEQYRLCILNDALGVETCALRIDRTGTTVDSITLASTAITLNAATTIPGGALTPLTITNTGAASQIRVSSNQTPTAEFGADVNGAYVQGSTASGGIRFYTNATLRGAWSPSTGVLDLTATPTRSGNAIWDAGNDGAGSGLDADTLDTISSAGFQQVDAARSNFVARSGTVTSRTSDATNTCDANLTLSLPNATAHYTLYAFLKFDGNGITANGWSILPGASTGTVAVDWLGTASTNTTTANAAPTSNTGVGGGDMDATFNAAGVETYVVVQGVVSVTAGSAPAVCIAWGQTASNATATDLNIGSFMQLVRLN